MAVAGRKERKPVEPRKETWRERTAHLLDLPAEGVAEVPRLSLVGDRTLFLEGYRDVLSYGKEEIHVDGGAFVLRVQGRDLEIKAMREGEVRIEGWLTGLTLL
jgi:sporulation protein YqfC